MIEQEKFRRVARELIRIVHECDAGMKQGVFQYREEAQSGNPQRALGLLKRAVRLPYRVEARASEAVRKHGAARVNAALGAISTLTLADLQAVLEPLKNYSDLLVDRYRNQGWTAAQIASDIEASSADVDADEQVRIPQGYVDDM